jgi:hypothetical protein
MLPVAEVSNRSPEFEQLKITNEINAKKMVFFIVCVKFGAKLQKIRHIRKKKCKKFAHLLKKL